MKPCTLSKRQQLIFDKRVYSYYLDGFVVLYDRILMSGSRFCVMRHRVTHKRISLRGNQEKLVTRVNGVTTTTEKWKR